MVSKDSNIVLVVDDDPGMLKSVQRLLRLHAYEPILFSSVEAFKNYSDVEEAACVILDINLKDGSGIELRHGLNDEGIAVPVIFMTGNEDPAIRKVALNSGCIAFLTKPFSAQELTNRYIVRRLGRRRAYDRRACRRQVNTCCGHSPCRRAISETTAPETSVFLDDPGLVVLGKPTTASCLRDHLQPARRHIRLKRMVKHRHKPIPSKRS